MGEVQWIKIYIDMFDKRKIKKIRRLPAGNDLLLIWIMLLAMARKCNAGGMIYITESVPFTEEDLADELDFDLNTVKLALTAFRELDMIAIDEGGFINVLGWEEYQNADKLAELRAKDRERLRRILQVLLSRGLSLARWLLRKERKWKIIEYALSAKLYSTDTPYPI